MQVTILGSINVDTILSVDALPRPGETVLAHSSARLPGGKGANQAVAAARMGAATAMIGATGDDADGLWMRDLLSVEGIATDAVRTLPAMSTGAAAIAVDATAENLIVVVPGVNAALAATHLPATIAGVLLAQLEVPLDTIAAGLARANGPCLLNAAPAVAGAEELFGACDIVIVNEHELAFYARTPPSPSHDAIVLAARTLIASMERARDPVVVVTLGGDGALAVWHGRALHVPAFPVVPVDTVGAGDCFCGALAALLAEGMALEAALPRANAAAALCTQARGAAPAMPHRAAVERFATDHAPRVKNATGASLD